MPIIDNSSLDELSRIYSREPICLFTGAGVSFTASKRYQSPGWWALLEEVYERIRPTITASDRLPPFKRLRQDRDEWDVATILLRMVGNNQQQLVRIIAGALVGRTTANDKYRRLPIAYLQEASTLNAVIAFCSRLRAIRIHPCYEVNSSRVRGVVTLNYDCFLEAGATTKYQNGRVPWPVAAVGRSFGGGGGHQYSAIPGGLAVFHVHGYIPYRRTIEPTELVLTRESYEEAYRHHSATLSILAEYLSNYPTLFVGLSFRDRYLVELLKRLRRSLRRVTHFALLRNSDTEPALIRLLRDDAGVIPLLYDEHADIPGILGRIYTEGLDDKALVVPLESVHGKGCGERTISRAEYWELLLQNKR